MRWITLSHVHLDRVASPWLVKRFVDPDAEFEFLEWGADGELPSERLAEAVPPGVTPIGMPGVELSLHDAAGSCFSKVLRTYELTDPALWKMERIVSAGVSEALGLAARPDQTEEEAVLGSALNWLGSAFGVLFEDPDHIAHAIPVYDATYELCRLWELPQEVSSAAPKIPPLRIPYLRDALDQLDHRRPETT